MKKPILLLTTLLTGCVTSSPEFTNPAFPVEWSNGQGEGYVEVEPQALHRWWHRFDDAMLSRLVEMSLQHSPDRKLAFERIAEARGIQRTAKSALFPKVDIVGAVGREDTGRDGTPDDFYEAGFDASYELDVFGENLARAKAGDARVNASIDAYFDVSLSLAAEVVRTYVEYREFQKQVHIANNNLHTQLQTLDLITDLVEVGESPQLDVERSRNLVNTTRASIPAFQRGADQARLRLTVLTGSLPEEILLLLDESTQIPGLAITPVLLSPAKVISLRPDVRASAANLAAATRLAQAEIASIFPSFDLGGFFGVADSASINSTTVWSVFLEGAFALLDFGHIEGRIDTARAVESQAYQLYRKTVLEAVVDVETALHDYAHINQQRISLQVAYENASSALALSSALFAEGEISFLDVLDAERTVNQADSALVTAEGEQVQSLVRIFKALGVY